MISKCGSNDGAWPLIHFDALPDDVQAAQVRIAVVKATTAFPDQAAALTAVITQQFTASARLGLLTAASRGDNAGVSADTLYHGRMPLFAGSGSTQPAMKLRDAAAARAPK